MKTKERAAEQICNSKGFAMTTPARKRLVCHAWLDIQSPLIDTQDQLVGIQYMLSSVLLWLHLEPMSTNATALRKESHVPAGILAGTSD